MISDTVSSNILKLQQNFLFQDNFKLKITLRPSNPNTFHKQLFLSVCFGEKKQTTKHNLSIFQKVILIYTTVLHKGSAHEQLREKTPNTNWGEKID